MTANRSATGSTRGWRRLREDFAARLPLPCAICQLPVKPDPVNPDGSLATPDGKSLWHLHHTVVFRLGGKLVWPSHKLCNLQAGDRQVHKPYVDPTMPV